MVIDNKGQFKKGMVPWNKGKTLTKEQKEHLREVNLGKRLSQKTRLKISLSHKGSKAYQWKDGTTARHLNIRKSILKDFLNIQS